MSSIDAGRRTAGFRNERHELRSRHEDADDLSVPLPELLEVQPQEGGEPRVGVLRQVRTAKLGRKFIVRTLAVRMKMVPPRMAAQVAVERGADVVQLVEERHHFLVEVLVEIARQAERQQ